MLGISETPEPDDALPRPAGAAGLATRVARRAWRRIEARGRDHSDEDLSGADMSRRDLSGANLHNAQAFGTNLSGADLRGARIDRLAIDLRTCLQGALLSAGAHDTYVHIRVRDEADATTLAGYGIEALADNFVFLEYSDFLRLQPLFGYRTE